MLNCQGLEAWEARGGQFPNSQFSEVLLGWMAPLSWWCVFSLGTFAALLMTFKMAKTSPTGYILCLITPIIDFIGWHLTEEAC